MQNVSSTYNSIFADAAHRVEWKVTVNGTVYGEDKLVFSAGGDSRPKIRRALFSEAEPVIGKCLAASFSCAIVEASGNIPRMAELVPAFRLTLGATQSEWVTLGTFYIDTRKTDKSTGALMLTAYDRMLMADGENGKTYAELTGFTTWPQTMAAVATEIATIMGISIDSRTTVSSSMNVEYPNDLTMREVLGYIGTAHGGNWTITPGNKLRLVRITGNTDGVIVGTNGTKLETAPALTAWTGVTLYWDDENAYSAGTDTGRVLVCECPWATQAMANGILQVINGSTYQPYTMPGAILNLAAELGDQLTLGSSGDTVTGAVMEINITAGGLEQADIAAPGEAEIDHEYPYASAVDRSMRRSVRVGANYYGNTISREYGFKSELDSGAYGQFNADGIQFTDENGQQCLYYDANKGTFVFDGTLGANAMFTESLYAENGDVAELTVDQVSTSTRVKEFLLDTYYRQSAQYNDDNYIRISGKDVEWVTGSVVMVSNVAQTEQLENRKGVDMYWSKAIVSVTSDGYPLDADGDQIYITEDETLYPVMVYQYAELVKLSAAFELVSGTYVPQIILGAGDGSGGSQGKVWKDASGLRLQYVTSGGAKTLSVTLGDDGYVDVDRMRKPTAYNFSGIGNGSFTETVDGGTAQTYTVTKDGQGRITKITDPDGHETVVSW